MEKIIISLNMDIFIIRSRMLPKSIKCIIPILLELKRKVKHLMLLPAKY